MRTMRAHANRANKVVRTLVLQRHFVAMTRVDP
jgi:hypothetical protein